MLCRRDKGGLCILGVLLIICAVVWVRRCTQPESYDEFLVRFGKVSGGFVSESDGTKGPSSKSEFFGIMGKPYRATRVGDDIRLYYRVKEGVVRITVDKYWWEYENRILVTGYTRRGGLDLYH